jgi:TadE-like protein
VKNRITHNLQRFSTWLKPHNERGQSMVEMALAFPILLLVLAGTLEVGKYFNDYLTILDATREAARYAADSDLLLHNDDLSEVWPGEEGKKCNTDFSYQAACLARQNMFGISFNKATDDVIVSALTVDTNGQIIARYPQNCPSSAPSFLPNYCDSKVTSDEQGWSYCTHVVQVNAGSTYCRPATSRFSNAAIESLLANSPSSTPTGLVIVEIYRMHKQFLGLIPPGLAFLPQEVVMHAYTMMPLPSSAPPPSYTP